MTDHSRRRRRRRRRRKECEMSSTSSTAPPPKKEQNGPIQSMVAGGIAGIVSRTAVSPLERVKILQQIQFVTGHDKTPKYTSQMQALRRILAEEGVRGFFKGNGANCIRVFPYAGTQFLVFDQLADVVRKYTNRSVLTPMEKQFVGGMAGVCSVLLTYPMDMVRGRLTAMGGALENTKYNGMTDAFAKIVRTEGGLALFQGITPTLLGIYPYVALNYLTYETIKEFNSNKDSFAWRLLAAGVAGTTGQTVAYPLDLLRRRFQMQAAPGNPLPKEKRYRSVAHALRTIVKEEGFGGLYKGFTANFIKTWPTITIMFIVNDSMLDLFKRV
jgi:solute carrier family 25 phosphate transporter 23/24/25/41